MSYINGSSGTKVELLAQSPEATWQELRALFCTEVFCGPIHWVALAT
jgi:hypothetical protein